MPEHPYGFLSLLPSVVAIFLAIATRRTILSLLAGVFVGALILAHGNLAVALSEVLQTHLWTTLTDKDRLAVFAFTSLMAAMVGIISRNGGMRGLVELVTLWAINRRRGQLVTWLLGLFIFFDDYANTILLGNTLRPLTDRLRISREKLAYLVDSTAAPVAGLSLISTWVATEIDFVQQGIKKLPVTGGDWTALNVFVNSIPYRFYVLWALTFVLFVAWSCRDFGPMLRAERRRFSAKDTDDTDNQCLSDQAPEEENVSGQWYHAVVPVLVTVATIIYLLYATGRGEFRADQSPTLMDIFGAANAYGALLCGALMGVVVAAIMSRVQGLLHEAQILSAATQGALLVVPALTILWLASALSAMTGGEPLAADDLRQNQTLAVVRALSACGLSNEMICRTLQQQGATRPEIDVALSQTNPTNESLIAAERYAYRYAHYRLYTGVYLGNLLSEGLPAALLPTIVFLLAAVISFATGTSWGTMGIVMPLAIPVTFAILSAGGASVAPSHPILLGSIASVLAGAIFGDHSSPISDTTVLSSQASGCDHVAHVWTQLPYALLVGIVAVLCGTLPIGFGAPVWVLLPIGAALLGGMLFVWGRRAENE